MKAHRDRPPPRAFAAQSWTDLLRARVGEAEAKDFAATVLGAEVPHRREQHAARSGRRRFERRVRVANEVEDGAIGGHLQQDVRLAADHESRHADRKRGTHRVEVHLGYERKEVEVLRTPVSEVHGDGGAKSEMEILRLREPRYAIQSAELFLRKSGGAAHVSFSASKKARQNPRVRSLISGAHTSRKNA